jgi:hypothetical protein
MKSPRFTDDQRVRLAQLGVVTEQVQTLEGILGLLRAMLSPAATLREVRGALDDTRKQARAAHHAITKLLSSQYVATREARVRVQVAESDMGLEVGAVPEAAAASLQTLLTVLAQARGALSNEQRRSEAASPWPVARIEKALLDGFVAHHDPRREGPMPPRTLLPSRNAEFLEIVEICYRASVGRETSPDRAIRAYLAVAKRRSGLRKHEHD